jgi:hypothetical protein
MSKPINPRPSSKTVRGLTSNSMISGKSMTHWESRRVDRIDRVPVPVLDDAV